MMLTLPVLSGLGRLSSVTVHIPSSNCWDGIPEPAPVLGYYTDITQLHKWLASNLMQGIPPSHVLLRSSVLV